MYLPSGTWLVIWTSLATSKEPFLSGQLRSTFGSWSHRSASSLRMITELYLTVRYSFAPASTSFNSVPLASTVRLLPLYMQYSASYNETKPNEDAGEAKAQR